MSASGRILASAVFQLAHPPEELPPNLRLTSASWSVLFSLSGRHSVAQIGTQLSLTLEARDRAFEELAAAGLLVERRLSLPEYLRSVGTTDDPEAKTFAAFLRGAPARPAAVPPIGPEIGVVEPVELPSGAAVAPPAPADALRRERVPVLPQTPFRPLALPEEEIPMNVPPSSPPRALNLRALNQLFFDRAASPEQAQLDIYRVYLRIDAQVLKKAGVTSLKFEEDRVVEEPELIARLAESAVETLGAPLPDSVWVVPRLTT